MSKGLRGVSSAAAAALLPPLARFAGLVLQMSAKMWREWCAGVLEAMRLQLFSTMPISWAALDMSLSDFKARLNSHHLVVHATGLELKQV